ncbi:MAG TPA: ABC transporter ATP-binding protein, partial [Hellea balneolensis]|nr:ABC transporter ATP-binding protein [Hellea balneolensis]
MNIILNNLSVGYGAHPQIKAINAQIKQGEFIGLVGVNGSGKTCLLKTLAGLLTPLTGDIRVDGTPLPTIPVRARAKHISYLAQERRAVWSGTVKDFVALGRTPYRGPLGRLSPDDHTAISEALHMAGCEDLKDRHFHHLSGGEQARVYLARTLAVGAPFILADEPIAALDPAHQIATLSQLQMQAQAGTTIIASLHDLGLA